MPKLRPKSLLPQIVDTILGLDGQTQSDVREESRSDAQNGERDTIGGTSVYARDNR